MPKSRPPLPPFSFDSAVQKVRQAEDAWNTRDPERVALAYTEDSLWRNRAEFLQGRTAIVEFLKRKWAKELDYRLIKELWAFHENRISVRFHNWRKSTTFPVVEEINAWLRSKWTKTRFVALCEHHLGAALFAKEVETTMTSDSYVNHFPTMTGGVGASELRHFT